MWYNHDKVIEMVDEVTIRGLLALGAALTMFLGPHAWWKISDSYHERKARKAPTSRRLASIDWLDPDLRRN